MLSQSKKHIACRLSTVLIAVVLSPMVGADDFEKRYPNLPDGVGYRFEYWENLVTRSTDPAPRIAVPEQAIDLIMMYYNVPEELRQKLFSQPLFVFDGNYLIKVGVLGANDVGKFPKEFVANKAIAQKTCDVVSEQFDTSCETLHDIALSRPQVIVNLKDKNVIPIPSDVKATGTEEPSIDTEDFDWTARESISLFKNLYIELGSPVSPGLLEDMKFSFKGEPVSHRCFAGSYGIADVNGDGVKDLLVIGGRFNDSLLDWQVVEKTYAYSRIYTIAIDISKGIAKPLFQDELFAYEMDYNRQSEGVGEGIVREARFYWGDFNKDGKADYLVRRQHADISIKWGRGAPGWRTGPAREDAIIYEGDGAGYRKSSASGDSFVTYIQEHTEWNKGFPDSDNCL